MSTLTEGRLSPAQKQGRRFVRKVAPVLNWNLVKGDAINADLSCAGPYVISHRPNQYALCYRPPGEHHPLGVFPNEKEARDTAAAHALPPRRPRRSLIADVEHQLREHGNPYVAVNEAKKALFAHAALKTFHFVVYDKQADNWLLWCGKPTAAVRQDMAQWAQVFGDGFQVVYALRRKDGIVYKSAAGARLTLNGESTSTTTVISQVDGRRNLCGT